MQAPDLLAAALRWLELAGLLGFTGAVVVRRLAANPPPLPWARPRLQLVLGLALAGGLATAVDQFVFGAGVTLGVLIRIAAEAVALALCMTIGRGAVPVGFVAVLVIALSGHAPRVDPPVPAIIDEAIHVVSAGMWAGGIVVLAALHPPGGWRGEEGRELIERFGRVAILALAITALTGVLRATQELTAVSDLWATGYGAVLAAKSAGVLAMAAMSALTWRRGLPLARVEAALGLAVIGASGLLAAFPMPPGQA